MDFKDYFVRHAEKHSCLQPQDVAKFCYQAAFGAEHLLSDVSAARRYFDAELDSVNARAGELTEDLTDRLCRVDLGVWKARGLSRDALFDAFVESAGVKSGDREVLCGYLCDAEASFSSLSLDFLLDEWRAFLDSYREAGMPAIHHSAVYREREKPSYRVVGRELLEKIL